ncbi:MAG: N-acetylmuramoyl-L-alanine amidase [Pseudomonadota bacterium]
MRTLLAALLIVLLAGCATTTETPVDRTYAAKGQSSRVKFVVLHYTVSDRPQSLKILTEQVVSAHYLLTDEPAPVIYGLVDETRQANHAGVSYWKGYTQLNASSIGIEIVNPGFTEGPDGRIWYPFPQAQVDRLIVLLKEIVARHKIPPENILGHADIAPQRKQDPGPMFPWIQLAQHGLVQWPDGAKLAAARPLYEQQLPDVAWFQQKLGVFGYAVPQNGELDAATRSVITAFQMRYRPATIDGAPDAETAALLDALTAPVKKD